MHIPLIKHFAGGDAAVNQESKRRKGSLVKGKEKKRE